MSGDSSVTSSREYLHVPSKMMEGAADTMAGTCHRNTTNEPAACALRKRNKKSKVAVTVVIERNNSSIESEVLLFFNIL